MKYAIAILAVIVLLVIAIPALAQEGPDDFGGDNGVWVNDFGDHYVNTNNPDVRMDWDNHRFAVPGGGGYHASENSAVEGWTGGGTLVDPQDTCVGTCG